MSEGTVVFYNPTKQFGFIRPDGVSGKIFFHYSRGTLGGSSRNVPVPVPQKGDRVRYGVRGGEARALTWTFADIRQRLNTLTPAQQELVNQVLGDYAGEWEIRDAQEELAEDQRYPGREWFAANRTGPGPRGTFYQVLLWARYELGAHGPRLVRWPDMPRYTVRYLAGGQWNVIGLPHYTQVQAEAAAAHLRDEGRYDDVRVIDLWPDAPPLSVAEAAKVLAECGRVVLKDDWTGHTEVEWLHDKWDQRTRVAHGYFAGSHSYVALNGHSYKESESRQLEYCGRVLYTEFN